MISDNNIYWKLETPCYILDGQELLKSYSGFKSALNQYFPKNILSYSVKTNSLPFLLSKIKDFGAYAEVVSHDEYSLAKECGYSIDRIVYNGPLKSKETFIEAIENGAIVNIETKRELDWLSLLRKDKVYNVGIRLNVNLDVISPSDAKEGEGQSRFGYIESSGELQFFIERLNLIENVSLTGIHVHRTSKTRSVEMYKNLSKWILTIIRKYDLNLKYIDFGGGFFGIMSDKPTYNDYAKAIYLELHNNIDLKKTTIIVEPGNALIASSFSFLSEIIDEKKMGDYYVYTSDGSRIDIDPFFHKQSYSYETILRNNETREIVKKQLIGGCTCLENDIIFELNNSEKLQEGDLILYKSVGAYTMTLSPLFIRYFPKVYYKADESYNLVRENWKSTDIIKKI